MAKPGPKPSCLCKKCPRCKQRQRQQDWRDSGGGGNYSTRLAVKLEMLTAQNGLCAICGEEIDKKAHLDHCHKTGKNRAVLCQHCNRGLGHFRDNPTMLRLAADYIERFEVD